MSSEQAREHLGQISNRLGQMESQLAELRGELTATAARLEQPPRVEAPPSNGSAPTGRLELEHVNEALRKLAQGEEQERILEIFLEEAQSYVQRAILFLNQDGKYVTWKGFGFQPDAIRSLALSDPQETIVQSAERRQLVYRRDHPEDSLPWLKSAGEIPSSVFCIPLVFENSVPVVFYGDSNDTIAIDSLELLTHLAVLVLKNNYLHQQLNAQQEMASVQAPPAPVEEPAPEEAPAAVEETSEALDPMEGVAAALGSVATASAMAPEAAEEEEQQEKVEPVLETVDQDLLEAVAGDESFPTVEKHEGRDSADPLEELELVMDSEEESMSAEADKPEAPVVAEEPDIPLEKKEIDFEFDFASEENEVEFEIDLDTTPGIESLEADRAADDASVPEEGSIEFPSGEELPPFETEGHTLEVEEPISQDDTAPQASDEELSVPYTEHAPEPEVEEAAGIEAVAQDAESGIEDVLDAPIFAAEPAPEEPLVAADPIFAEAPAEEEAWDPSEAETEDALPVVEVEDSEPMTPPAPPEEALSVEPSLKDEAWDPSEAETEDALPVVEVEESAPPDDVSLEGVSDIPEFDAAPESETPVDDSPAMAAPAAPPIESADEIVIEPEAPSIEPSEEAGEAPDFTFETFEGEAEAEEFEAPGAPWAEAFEQPPEESVAPVAEAVVEDSEAAEAAEAEPSAEAGDEAAVEDTSDRSEVAMSEGATAPEEAAAVAEESVEDAEPPPLTEEEKKAHDEARRFARLLVSEIKLYNEDDVEAGRQHSDLYRRLRRDVDRSREMFDRRVSAAVAESVDYFHQEMVRILAKGDAGLLGEDYPGPHVSD